MAYEARYALILAVKLGSICKLYIRDIELLVYIAKCAAFNAILLQMPFTTYTDECFPHHNLF